MFLPVHGGHPTPTPRPYRNKPIYIPARLYVHNTQLFFLRGLIKPPGRDTAVLCRKPRSAIHDSWGPSFFCSIEQQCMYAEGRERINQKAVVIIRTFCSAFFLHPYLVPLITQTVHVRRRIRECR